MICNELLYHTGVLGMHWGIRKNKVTGPTNLVDRNDIESIKKYKMAIIGEIHGPDMIKYYDKLLSEKKPEFFICEFADQDRCYDRATLKDRMAHATDGSFEGSGADYQYNYWCYNLAYKHNCKLIGCNPTGYNKTKSMNNEDNIRESFMLNTLKEFEGKNSVVQLGDHHLRSIPISKDFLDYSGDKVDDRGLVTDLTVANASPIWDYFSNKKDTCISRVPSEYNNESRFNKKGGIQLDILEHSGVLGMKWGFHRASKSGIATSHSKKNKPVVVKKRSVKDLSDQELTDIIRRMDNEKRYNDFMKAQIKTTGSAKAKEFVTSVLEKSGKEVASKVVTYALGKAINKMMHDTVISVGKDIPKKKDD